MPPTQLHNGWRLYFHDPDAKEWKKEAIQTIATIKTVEDFVILTKEMKQMWSQGMFFVMREHIQPEWEDPHCREGGCISYKINKPEVPKAWFELCAKALGESLIDVPSSYQGISPVCGVSISPKRNYCILRIWVSQPIFSDIQMFHLKLPLSATVTYKPHIMTPDATDKA